jgi:hypothetical protein
MNQLYFLRGNNCSCYVKVNKPTFQNPNPEFTRPYICYLLAIVSARKWVERISAWNQCKSYHIHALNHMTMPFNVPLTPLFPPLTAIFPISIIQIIPQPQRSISHITPKSLPYKSSSSIYAHFPFIKIHLEPSLSSKWTLLMITLVGLQQFNT